MNLKRKATTLFLLSSAALSAAISLSLSASSQSEATPLFADDSSVKSLTIFGCQKSNSSATAGGANGMFYRVYATQGIVAYGEEYKGEAYDSSGERHEVLVRNVAGSTTMADGTSVHLIDIKMEEAFISPLILKKSTVFTQTNDETSKLSFDKSYQLTHVKDFSPASVSEYGEPKLNAIRDCVKSCDDPAEGGSSGMFYRFHLKLGITAYNATYSGAVYDEYGIKHAISFYDRGSEDVSDGETTSKYRIVDLQMASSFIPKVYISSDTVFKNVADEADCFSFEKNYCVSHVKNWQPASVEEVDEVNMAATMEIDTSSDLKCSEEERRFRFLVEDSIVEEGKTYTGLVYDIYDESYEATLEAKGIDEASGERVLDLKLSVWKSPFIIKTTTLFVSDDNPNFKFTMAKQYLVSKASGNKTSVQVYAGPISVSLSDGLIASAVDFDTASFDVPLCYASGDNVPSYFARGTLTLNKTEIKDGKTHFSLCLSANGGLDSFLIRKKNLLASDNAKLPIIEIDKDYECTRQEDGSYLLGEVSESESAAFTLGNSRWATSLKSGGYSNLVSFDYSCLSGIHSLQNNTPYYGKVYSKSGEEIKAQIVAFEVEEVIDTTLFRCGIYVASNEEEFILKKETEFTRDENAKWSSSGPASIASEYDYDIVFTPDSSAISKTLIGSSKDKTADEAPSILYKGEKTLYKKEGDSAPLFLVSATDAFGMDVLVDRVFSEGAVDSRGRLRKGEHTCTFIAKDSYGNSSELVIAIIVD